MNEQPSRLLTLFQITAEMGEGEMQVLRLRGCAASLRMTDLFFVGGVVVERSFGASLFV
jgi:predicted DNA-binding ribbon-helix-helix protein